MDLDKLSVEDAKLVQRGLQSLGFYNGTFGGRPGPKTRAAYNRYVKSFSSLSERDVGAELARVLLKEVGVVEIPRDSNMGPRVNEYKAATWLDASKPWPWCAAFVCWGLKVLNDRRKLPFARPRTAAAFDFERWAKEQGLEVIKKPTTLSKGDIVIFKFSHIGVASGGEAGGYFDCVEGNTDKKGDREGGGVFNQTRSMQLVRSIIKLK